MGRVESPKEIAENLQSMWIKNDCDIGDVTVSVNIENALRATFHCALDAAAGVAEEESGHGDWDNIPKQIAAKIRALKEE